MKRAISAITALITFACLCFVFYNVRETVFFEKSVPISTKKLTFEGSEITDFDELCGGLEKYKRLEKVELGTFPVYPEEAEELTDKYPNVTFEYTPYVSVYGKGFMEASEELDLTTSVITDTAELKEKLPLFTELKKVALGENTISEAEAYELKNIFPEIDFSMCIIYDI